MSNMWCIYVAATFLLTSHALPSVNKHSGDISRCVWDGTGCFDNGCDVDQRQSNCLKFEQQESCESDTGKDNRCRWSYDDAVADLSADAYGNGCGYGNPNPCDDLSVEKKTTSRSMLFGMINFDIILGSFEMTWDLMMLAGALFVLFAWIGFNFVRWCQRPKKFEYEPINEVEMPRV